MHRCTRCESDCDCDAIPCQHLCLQFADEMECPPLDGPFTGRTLTVSASVEPDPPPPTFMVGDLVTLGKSKTRWRVKEVVENGVTMIQIVPEGR